ncbi:MAG TPA: hypothetical protein VEO54_15750 [Thermoanaerobaculia bacterium]|nr:hypothetical protein [Thermoanaerobaculia bacterium]
MAAVVASAGGLKPALRSAHALLLPDVGRASARPGLARSDD